jgi:formate hydrogenlyase subunit 3/multisubunit Na+/H+ antiporter MnhD subunit
MTTGIIALAVPFSTAFAGEFLILAGVFRHGWGWAVVGAAAIVLAAMYILRMISGVLHQEVGAAVPEAALDLRPGELAVVVPLVGILLALSAWPASISQHAFPRGGGQRSVQLEFRSASEAMMLLEAEIRSLGPAPYPEGIIVSPDGGYRVDTVP